MVVFFVFVCHTKYWNYHKLLVHWQVSATFAASLVLSPALGTWVCTFNGGVTQVVLLATLLSLFNLLFIVYVVPESLPETSRSSSWGSAITWEQADPFAVSQ